MINYSEEFNLNHFDDDRLGYGGGDGQNGRKPGRPKKEKTGLPQKPGNWRSLGERPKYDLVSGERTAPPVWNNDSGLSHTGKRTRITSIGHSGPNGPQRKPGRPPGAKKQQSSGWLTDADRTTGPTYSSPQYSQSIIKQENADHNTGEALDGNGVNNAFRDLQIYIESFWEYLKADVMTECGWSIATFHRRMKTSVVSKAEAMMITTLIKKHWSMFETHVKDLMGPNK
ncbi:hypothetical protein [Chitinophaga hostae]|uniref:Uncharacterized protein n=1 Tax=Chitinophaga hostae TaxID=2831022 RepID=A0ABS5IVU6_9BACT|nr:hypothetical protein [Chitinophaga hostae]MBS0027083.1 hypothetical protein [Chitinophaga hostae]